MAINRCKNQIEHVQNFDSNKIYPLFVAILKFEHMNILKYYCQNGTNIRKSPFFLFVSCVYYP